MTAGANKEQLVTVTSILWLTWLQTLYYVAPIAFLYNNTMLLFLLCGYFTKLIGLLSVQGFIQAQEVWEDFLKFGKEDKNENCEMCALFFGGGGGGVSKFWSGGCSPKSLQETLSICILLNYTTRFLFHSTINYVENNFASTHIFTTQNMFICTNIRIDSPKKVEFHFPARCYSRVKFKFILHMFR